MAGAPQRIEAEAQLHETRHVLQLELSRARARLQEYEKKDPKALVREGAAKPKEARRVELSEVGAMRMRMRPFRIKQQQ